MRKNKAIILISFIFILLVTIASYLYLRYSRLSSIVTKDKVPGPNNEIAVLANDPIKKTFRDDGRIVYIIEGSFKSSLSRRENSYLISGIFIIRDDPLQREITTYVGGLDGNTFLGRYNNSLNGVSNWTVVPTEDIIDMIKPGDPVLLRYPLVLGQENAGIIDYVKKQEEIVDALIEEFHASDFKFEISESFYLNTSDIGIVE